MFIYNSLLLEDKLLRFSLINFISDNNPILIPFYKFIYNMTLDQEIIKKDLYHRIDKKILDQLNIDSFIDKFDSFIRKSKARKPEFNKYPFKLYD